jgi:predicted transcriptional regulator
MLTCPTVHRPSTTIGQLRPFFSDDHVHMALLVEGQKLVGTIERADITPRLSAEMPASTIARLEGRTISPDDALPEAFDAMTRAGRRRLAVTSHNSTLLGLLCLKASGLGFCSNADVANPRLHEQAHKRALMRCGQRAGRDIVRPRSPAS